MAVRLRRIHTVLAPASSLSAAAATSKAMNGTYCHDGLCNALVVMLSEIARRCGLGDEQRLRRAFKRQIGITPDAFRSRFAKDLTREQLEAEPESN